MFDQVKQKLPKQLEVGGSRSVSPISSTSTNVSSLNSFPSTSEKPVPLLSPLTECAENIEPNLLLRYRSTLSTSECLPNKRDEPSSCNSNPISSSLPQSSVMCDGQLQQQQHNHNRQPDSGGSSPFADPGPTDFMGTEFYMDESLPSSLSEHPSDGQHQAIVSLLQVLDELLLATKTTRSRSCTLREKKTT